MNDIPLDDVSWLQELDWSGYMSTKPPFENCNHASTFLPDEQPQNVQSWSFPGPVQLESQEHGTMQRTRDRSQRQDSDCSWTEADNQDEWYEILRHELREFRQGQRSTLFTTPLSSRQRKQVHSMANLWGLSHMSIGSGSLKRVLVCKSMIAADAEGMGAFSKQWNPRGNAWWPGYVDPRLILIHWISSNMCLQTCLQVLGLPVPSNLTMDVRGDYGTAYALFANATDAATTVLALDRQRPAWNTTSLNRDVECSYLRFPQGFELTPDLLGDSFHQLPVLVYQAFSTNSSANPNQPLSRPPSRAAGSTALYNPPLRNKPSTNSLSAIDERKALTDLADQLKQFPPLSLSNTPSYEASRRHSRTSSYSRDLGYASASSQVDSDYSHATNRSKKRKREPMIPGGYLCSVDGCDKAFDHDGERRKHERNHSGERPHICKRCGKGFLYPKDLRRHTRTHGGSAQASPTLERVSDASDVDELDIGSPRTARALSPQPHFTSIISTTMAQPAKLDNLTHPRHGISKFSSKIAGVFGNGKKNTWKSALI